MLSQGILLGLGLSILVGPIVIALLEASLVQGFRAGISVGIGIWVSDAIFIASTYAGLNYIKQLTSWSGFGFTLGLIGGLVLIAFGLSAILFKPKAKITVIKENFPEKPLWRWAVKGFLINTLNPFTVFFWTGVAGSVIATADVGLNGAITFYLGVFLTIIFSDSLKVGLAKLIRKKLTATFVYKLQFVAGLALLIFGIGLIIRSIYLS